MKRRIAAVLVAAVAGAVGAFAAEPASPYAGQESRQIKALSPDDVAAYVGGKGQGLAKAAELNGFPGPAHVLELAEPLALTHDQRSRTQAIFTTMETRAREIGRALVEEERKLDLLFATKAVTRDALSKSLTEIGALQAQVRAVHLEAHLAQVEVLTPQQNARYAELRGYTGAGGHSGERGQHKH
jgi:Spy/CpxP family protein refolding chaperone